MSDEETENLRQAVLLAESKVISQRARKQRWMNRYAEVEQVQGKATERAQSKANIKICDEQIVLAEAKLNAAQRRAAVVEGRAIMEEENVQNSDFGYFPPAPGMVLRTNATLHMEEVAKALGLPTSQVRRGTLITGKAAEIFMASRNAEKMLETKMVRYVRNSGGQNA